MGRFDHCFSKKENMTDDDGDKAPTLSAPGNRVAQEGTPDREASGRTNNAATQGVQPSHELAVEASKPKARTQQSRNEPCNDTSFEDDVGTRLSLKMDMTFAQLKAKVDVESEARRQLEDRVRSPTRGGPTRQRTEGLQKRGVPARSQNTPTRRTPTKGMVPTRRVTTTAAY